MCLTAFLSSPSCQIAATLLIAGIVLAVFQQLFKAAVHVQKYEPAPGAKPFAGLPKRDAPVKPKKVKQTTSKKFAPQEGKWAAPAESVVPQVSVIGNPVDHRVPSPIAGKKKDFPAAAAGAAVAAPAAVPKARGGFEVVGKKVTSPAAASPTGAAAALAAVGAPGVPNVMDLIFQSSQPRAARDARPIRPFRPAQNADAKPSATPVSSPSADAAVAPAAIAAPVARPVAISDAHTGSRGWAKLDPVDDEE